MRMASCRVWNRRYDLARRTGLGSTASGHARAVPVGTGLPCRRRRHFIRAPDCRRHLSLSVPSLAWSSGSRGQYWRRTASSTYSAPSQTRVRAKVRERRTNLAGWATGSGAAGSPRLPCCVDSGIIIRSPVVDCNAGISSRVIFRMWRCARHNLEYLDPGTFWA